ncbi:MAG TPA: hypothetical protein VGI66_00365 [Streptosporangiaceae bacterium]
MDLVVLVVVLAFVVWVSKKLRNAASMVTVIDCGRLRRRLPAPRPGTGSVLADL